jgi:hypothetical protein
MTIHPVANGSYRKSSVAENTAAEERVSPGAQCQAERPDRLAEFRHLRRGGRKGRRGRNFNTVVITEQRHRAGRLAESQHDAIEILPLPNEPLLTLKFSYPDGTPVTACSIMQCPRR